jgi:RNA polymerase sigma-32 factor
MAAWETLLEAIPMDDREREILDRRLLSEVPDTLQEIGDRWGVTRERIRQIEAGLIARLREAAVTAGLKEAA